ncbi:ABC transporter permease [Hydrogenovibrio halophilus]|uniref:ABC transporter permease n=1 Tax=Hydrogenovibrio halophilus TaxID=373391 RepID=UPI00037CC4BE|nr:ABC transporter permease [Hydrogenovibrio halophilus]
MLKSLWHYRAYILSAIHSDLRQRVIRSKIGFFWMLVQPLVMALIYALILSNILSAKLEGVDSAYAYPVYLMAGIVGWSIFAETLSKSLTMFIDHAQQIQKLIMPRAVIPIVVIGQTAVTGILLAAAVTLVIAFIDHPLTLQLFWLPLLVILTLMLASSLGLILGLLNVFFRDIGQLIPVLLQIGFWLTPIVYMVSILPQKYQAWLQYNPMTHLVATYQQIFVYGNAPSLTTLGVWAGAIVLFYTLGFLLYRRVAAEMVEEL